MKKTNYLLCFVLLFFSCTEKKQPATYINPFICTQGDHGQWHPSALSPFGLVKLGPDTYPASLTGSGDLAHSGYDYSDNHIRGFSHFHKGSSGGTKKIDRAGLLALLPFSSEKTSEWIKSPIVEIEKETEIAKCGYYATQLKEDHILAELSATAHSGFHRYTFPKGSDAKLMISGRKGFFTAYKTNSHTIEGSLLYGTTTFFFKMTFNKPTILCSTFDGEGTLRSADRIEHVENGGYLCRFGEIGNEPLEVKVGVSITSAEGARKNFEAECDSFSFDDIRKQTFGKWNDILSRIEIDGNNEERKTIFYTALYHSCFLPVTFSDIDGTYLGLDGDVHTYPGFTFYGGYAFWDTFRSKYALYSLLVPDVFSDIASSLKEIYEQADSFVPYPESDHSPHGPSYKAKGEKGEMWSDCRHEHMIMVVMDAYEKGLCKFPLTDIYEYMKREVMLQMPAKYDTIGFIPTRADETSDYSWDNWTMAQAAKELKKDDDYAYFMKRADYWKNTFDPSIKYFRARAADGTWLDFPENPTENREKYTYEGSKWHLRWNSLHDIPGLINLFGNNEYFLKELNYFFDNGLYTQGNQIDLHVPFLFNFAGQPWKTQEWVHRICCDTIISRYRTHGLFTKPIVDRVYKATPDGYLLEMDDDYGCMSSWYALSTMGLFQVCPGQLEYQLFSPAFRKVKIKLPNNKTFEIDAKNYTDHCYYIQSMKFNGKTYKKFSINYRDIMNGGKLILEMGKKAYN